MDCRATAGHRQRETHAALRCQARRAGKTLGETPRLRPTAGRTTAPPWIATLAQGLSLRRLHPPASKPDAHGHLGGASRFLRGRSSDTAHRIQDESLSRAAPGLRTARHRRQPPRVAPRHGNFPRIPARATSRQPARDRRLARSSDRSGTRPPRELRPANAPAAPTRRPAPADARAPDRAAARLSTRKPRKTFLRNAPCRECSGAPRRPPRPPDAAPRRTRPAQDVGDVSWTYHSINPPTPLGATRGSIDEIKSQL